MNHPKFSFNALMLIAVIVSAIVFFFTVSLYDLAAGRLSFNDYYKIEGTDYAIRHSTKRPSGVYKGLETTGDLIAEGSFAGDESMVLDGTVLWVNEYDLTKFQMVLCGVTRVDLETGEKQKILENSILRGRCASGELVCVSGVMLPVVYPETNALCRLYSLSSGDVRTGNPGADVVYLDPKTGDEVYRVRDEDVWSDGFEDRYLLRSLSEVRG